MISQEHVMWDSCRLPVKEWPTTQIFDSEEQICQLDLEEKIILETFVMENLKHKKAVKILPGSI